MTEFEKNPNPTKDQHFMVDYEMIEYICRKASIGIGESVVEIGGGAGALTEALAKYGNPLTVIELDHYYAELLKEKFKDFSNVTVIEGNALDYQYVNYDRIVANLPYTITEPFLVQLARSGALYHNNKDKKSSSVKSITLVVSQNSTRKMVAPIQVSEGGSRHFNSEFGLISAICQTYFCVDIDQAIPSSAFYPEPAVTSFLVNLTPKKKKTTVDRIMEELLMDRTGKSPSIERVYQMMLTQGEIYNLNKYKTNVSKQNSSSFTSGAIRCSNIYDLSNAQISQLIKDLIRNDSKMKSSKKPSSSKSYVEDSYEYFMRTGRYDYDEELDEEEEISQNLTKWQIKSEETYKYLYDERRYNTLLHRGLEFLKKEELQNMLQIG